MGVESKEFQSILKTKNRCLNNSSISLYINNKNEALSLNKTKNYFDYGVVTLLGYMVLYIYRTIYLKNCNNYRQKNCSLLRLTRFRVIYKIAVDYQCWMTLKRKRNI